jgi:hypothetical protein
MVDATEAREPHFRVPFKQVEGVWVVVGLVPEPA